MNRKISAKEITQKTALALAKANFYLPQKVKNIFKKNYQTSKDKQEKKLWKLLLENASISEKSKLPICQDTGIVVAFVKIGNKVNIEGNLYQAINEGVKLAYKKHYLRKSVVNDPFERKNTDDNAPATIHLEINQGNRLEITFLIKGAGAENQSQLKIFPPAFGINGVKKFIIETVKNFGAFACPPLIIGVGIGGNFETAGILAKKALLRPLGKKNKNKFLAKLEKNLLDKINKLPIGLFGLKKGLTALAVNIETAPSHIASLPVAVNLQCHAFRFAKILI